MEEEKSAFELLSELYNGQKALSTRMINLEEALLLILRELREKENILNAMPEEKREEVFSMEPSDPEPKVKVEPVKKPAKNIRVVGKIKNDDGKGIGGVNIIIWDARNNKVKSTKTNTAGSWFSFLPSGSYTAQYQNNEPKINSNINFEIKTDDKEVRI